MTMARVFRRVVVLAVIAVAALVPLPAWSQKYTPEEAPDHIGETATVCGVVMSPKFASKSKGQPTFLNLDRPYPNHIFTVLIWGKDRAKFGQPEVDFADKRICAQGLIAEFRGRPEIIVSDPAQLSIDR